MAIGYNIIQPNGVVKKQRVQSDKERDVAIDDQISKWSDYCNRNWISVNHSDPFCAESKVKMFLNGLAYFRMQGNTDGIVTDYKRLVNGKREIPISSCPAYVEDQVYGTGPTLLPNGDEALLRSEESDNGVKKPKSKKSKSGKKSKEKILSRFDKVAKIKSMIGRSDFYYPTVDTDNHFALKGNRYTIDDCISCYQGKQVGDDDVLFDMDKIICAITPDGRFYFFDMNFDSIPNEYIYRAD